MTLDYPRNYQGRRASRRSRYGCRNCKLRKLKCDEAKPQCRRCTSFGVLCNFMPNTSDLQPIRQWLSAKGEDPQPPLTNGVWASDASTCHQLDAKCQDFVTQYLGHSLITPDDSEMREVNRKLLALTFTYPFLMHASIAVALAYDRNLNSPPASRRTVEECYHLSQSTALFNKRLREPIETRDKDPIWGTAAALAMLTFAYPEGCTAEDSWPMKPSDSCDFAWLRVAEGKMSLWPIANPLRSDSLFFVMAATFAQLRSPLPEEGIDGIPRALAAVCHLRDSSTPKNNPYFHAAHAVSRVLVLADSEVTTGPAYLFIRSIHGPFKCLLQDKDPIALLLIYLWYCKTGRSIWWIGLRARVECASICLYLRLHHQHRDELHVFLPGGHLAEQGTY
ncbi:hypothetical protein F4778DRAFT_310174 [Xylariomycetidae sp. FL2044]|nr:hypothetical protein F4778DRAFT_310174 [Xylariomycetidae sp. FL2044]